jgi:uncharacterized protein
MSQDIALALEYKRRVVDAFHERVAKVVLFGSRARGDSRPDSDWDIAVFLQGEPSSGDLDRLSDLGFELLLETDQYIQVIPLPARREREESRFLSSIRQEGINL